jgi:hypothetical protein
MHQTGNDVRTNQKGGISMLRRRVFTGSLFVFGGLLISSFLGFNGCKQARNPQSLSGPSHSRNPDVSLKIFQRGTSGTNVTGVTITALAVDTHGNPQDGPEAFVNIPNPTFPLDVQLEVYVPPCTYQIQVVVSRDLGVVQTKEATVNACENTDVYITLDKLSQGGAQPEECLPGTECPTPLPTPTSLPTQPTYTPLPTLPPTPTLPPLP